MRKIIDEIIEGDMSLHPTEDKEGKSIQPTDGHIIKEVSYRDSEKMMREIVDEIVAGGLERRGNTSRDKGEKKRRMIEKMKY